MASSFPLMRLAYANEVDYGDVLLVALGCAHAVRDENMTADRWRQVHDAEARIDRAVGRHEADRLWVTILAHATGRWLEQARG